MGPVGGGNSGGFEGNGSRFWRFRFGTAGRLMGFVGVRVGVFKSECVEREKREGRRKCGGACGILKYFVFRFLWKYYNLSKFVMLFVLPAWPAFTKNLVLFFWAKNLKFFVFYHSSHFI